MARIVLAHDVRLGAAGEVASTSSQVLSCGMPGNPLFLCADTGTFDVTLSRKSSCAGWGSAVDARAGPVPERPRTHG